MQDRIRVSRLISKHHLYHPAYKEALDNSKDYQSLLHYLHTLDPYSRYMTPDHVEFLETREGEFRIDIGLDYLISNDQILVVPSPGGSAESVGLLSPAWLVSIEGNALEYADFSTYRFLTELEPGEKLQVVTRRPDENVVSSYLIPAQLRYRQLVMDFDLGDFGVIRIDRFKSGMGDKIAASIKKFSQKKRLIIDLRYNPGGDLFSAVDYLSLLMPKDLVVAYIKKHQQGPLLTLRSLSGNLLTQDRLLYVLVSRYTASSAEIFTQALKINRPNTLVVGEPTKGKCLASERLKLPDGSALELVTHEVVGADGMACEGRPLVPDKLIPDIAFQSLSDVLDELSDM
ncbi:MAG: S41 family peptidase [Chromatiales bacterium]